MEKHGKLIAANTLQFERILPGPIDRVWEYLVDKGKRGLWFASGPLEQKEGGNMELIFDHDKLSPEEDPIPEKYKQYENAKSSATVLKIDAPKILVVDWDGGVVTFELEERGESVKLTLTHEKLPTEKEDRMGIFAGWHTHLDIWVDYMHGQTPRGFWKVHSSLEDYYNELVS